MRDSILDGKSTGQRIEEEIRNWREEAKRASKRTEKIAWLALCVSIISMITQLIH